MPIHASNADIDSARDLVERYRQFASATSANAETWLRQEADSRAIPDAVPDAILVRDTISVIIPGGIYTIVVTRNVLGLVLWT